MTDIIYQRAMAREAAVWNSFQYNGPFNDIQQTERTIMFGLYANTYLHGHNYLNEIETEDLARLLDTYNTNIAKLTNEEAKLALDVAAKWYVDSIDQQIHEAKMVTEQARLDALDDEYDAKLAALSADEAAITTLQTRLEIDQEKARQRIEEIEIQIELEGVNQSLVDVDIAREELRSAQADLDLIEARLQGLNVQLAITQAGIDISNTELAITEADNEEDEMSLRITEEAQRESEVDLAIASEAVTLQKTIAEGERIQSQTKGVAVSVAETNVKITETELRENQLTAEIANIEADTTKLGLIDSDLIIANAEKAVMQAENALLQREIAMLNDEADYIEDETGFIEDQTEVQNDLDSKRIELEDQQHGYETTVLEKETEAITNETDKKISAIDDWRYDLVDDKNERLKAEARDKEDLLDLKADAAEAYKDAAIEAAEMLAGANLMAELTHSVGEGSALPETNVSWSTQSSL